MSSSKSLGAKESANDEIKLEPFPSPLKLNVVSQPDKDPFADPSPKHINRSNEFLQYLRSQRLRESVNKAFFMLMSPRLAIYEYTFIILTLTQFLLLVITIVYIIPSTIRHKIINKGVLYTLDTIPDDAIDYNFFAQLIPQHHQ